MLEMSWKENLEKLVCPACRSRLELRAPAEAKAEELRCTGCARAYPVRDDIPILLVDQAKLEP
jgi:uncharacterized protein YbaR (Trm112 family)